MRVAFKEWAVVVDQLGRGDQILILRKGGIAEGPGGFQPEHDRFWLFPTRFHQQRESVVPSAQARYDELLRQQGPEDIVRIEFFAQVTASRRLTCLSDAERLRGQHCWTDAVVTTRFDWGPAQNIYALALRVFRLPRPVELPMLLSYGGCRSWIELETDVPTAEAAPVLDTVTFDQKLARFFTALNPASA